MTDLLDHNVPNQVGIAGCHVECLSLGCHAQVWLLAGVTGAVTPCSSEHVPVSMGCSNWGGGAIGGAAGS